MSRERATVWLAWFLGVVFILMGLAEMVVRIIDWQGAGAMAFWVLTLCGGGALILIGSFAVKSRRRLSSGLVATGCVVASVPSAWTLLLPILAITLLVLTVQGAETAPAGAPT